MHSAIYVAPISTPETGSVGHIRHRLHEMFGPPVEVLSPALDPCSALNEKRGQYNSTTLLAELLGLLPDDKAKIIGVTDVDLFIPVLTYVFGEAQLGGNVAIASTYRLRNELYGLPSDSSLLLKRLEKEVVHELGHVFNLIHCDNYTCVMHASTYVEDIDLKNVEFCGACREAIDSG